MQYQLKKLLAVNEKWHDKLKVCEEGAREVQ
jgi:hypothetical protein